MAIDVDMSGVIPFELVSIDWTYSPPSRKRNIAEMAN